MHGQTLFLTLAFAASLLLPAAAADPAVEAPLLDSLAPGAIAQSNDGFPLAVDEVALPDAGEVVGDASDILPVEALPVSLEVDAEAQAQGIAPPSVEVGAPQNDPSSTLQHVAEIAAPAAAPVAATALLGFLAFGGDGLRALPGRLGSLLGRGWRLLAGLGLAVPLFSRIEQGNLLDNPIRARVQGIIAQDPGLSLSEVTTRAGIAWGTAVHHLRRLESHGKVVSLRQLGHRRYFIANTEAASQRTAMAVVMHPTARRIAELVSQRPGIDQAGICLALGLHNPAASKHLSQFVDQGLVLSSRSGRSKLYQATGGLHSALRLLEPEGTVARAHAHPQAVLGQVAVASA
ncbi:MAG: hypothetical protein QOJ26_1933 [Thermoplasmata archaeon]|nr:hypothetical protein [Thermoplasmata archaeon]